MEIGEYEEKLFNMITNCIKTHFKTCTARVAGGWIRDKLMGCKSSDLDIALDTVSGFEFACKLHEMYTDEISTAGLVKCNPDKSKHLETAVLNINGYFIDFVNLRKETYTTTRIPIIEYGTPKEDAFRRDLTVNALFYNLETREVEDFTGRGLEDLRLKVLRTPLDPYVTFSEDPLRILRVFRFHSKLGFAICEDIHVALMNDTLKTLLKERVSKERVYIELFKMIEYPMGHLGIFELVQKEYCGSIFSLPEGVIVDYKKSKLFFIRLIHFLRYFEKMKEEENNSEVYLCPQKASKNITPTQVATNDMLEPLEQYDNQISIEGLSIPDCFKASRWILNLYLLIFPLSSFKINIKNKEVFMVPHLLKTSLMVPNHVYKIINQIETGLYILDIMNLADCSLYNIYFILYYLKDYYFETLILKTCLLSLSNRSIKDIVYLTRRALEIKAETGTVHKSPLDPSKFVNQLDIDPKDISFLIAESIIVKQAEKEITNELLLKYLKKNKQEILYRHKRLFN